MSFIPVRGKKRSSWALSITCATVTGWPPITAAPRRSWREGVPPFELFAEMLGSPRGLCGGRAGHMHFADPLRRAIADGIVGSSAPTACGFTLESQLAGSGGVAVAFFGEGASSQGMLLESLNLAVVWNLPVIFVCKQSGLAITTTNKNTFGASLLRRARGFGMRARSMSGNDVEAAWRTAGCAIRRARRGRGPTFLLSKVHRPDGHFLGDPLLRIFSDPAGQTEEIAPSLIEALRRPGAPGGDRIRGLVRIADSARTAALESACARRDPLASSRARLDFIAAAVMEEHVRSEVAQAVAAARAAMPVTSAAGPAGGAGHG